MIQYPQFPRLADIGGRTLDAFNQSYDRAQLRHDDRLGVDAFGRYLDASQPQMGGPVSNVAFPGMSLSALGGDQAQGVQRQPLPAIGDTGKQARLPDPATARVQQAHGPLDSLIQNESGGNWQARNNAVGSGGQRGHFGRLQFGQARLADAKRAGVIPAGMTPEQFMNSPQAQQAVEQWHFSDIDQQAQAKGLTAYLGQNIGGVTITPDSIRSMAHLGGIGGAERFIKSGGRYNPADENGTRLSDYGQRHGGSAQQALEGMAVGESMPMQQQFAQAGGFPQAQPRQVQLPPREVMMDLFRSPATRQIAIGLAQAAQNGQQIEQFQTFQREDGSIWQMNTQTGQMQVLLRPDQTGDGGAPANFRALQMRAEAAGLQPGTPEYQQFMAQGGRSETEGAAGQRIQRLTENLMQTGDFMDPREAENIAVGIVDGRLRADRHPVTGELQVIDMATGRAVYGGPQVAQQQEAPAAPTADRPQFGAQYPNAQESFGVGGAAQRALNTAGDAIGIGAPYPDVQQTQSDFAVLRESLLNDIASSYGRQPPSWLLQEIRALTPSAGSPFEGAGGAQTKLRSLGRHLTNELEIARQALQRPLSPTNRQEMEARVAGLEAGIARVNGALQSFGGQQPQQPSSVQEGQTATNPQTGERLIFRNGQWERMQ